MPQWGMACLNLGGCAPAWEGVHQCERVFPSVGGNDLSHWGTPSHTGAQYNLVGINTD